MCLVAEATLAWGRVDGAHCEDVFLCEEVERLGWARADGVVAGIRTKAEGVFSREIMASEASCTGCVKLSVTAMVFVPRINADEKRGWVEGVCSGPRNAAHCSARAIHVFPVFA
jgi:hypothetical protein